MATQPRSALTKGWASMRWIVMGKSSSTTSPGFQVRFDPGVALFHVQLLHGLSGNGQLRALAPAGNAQMQGEAERLRRDQFILAIPELGLALSRGRGRVDRQFHLAVPGIAGFLRERQRGFVPNRTLPLPDA